MIKFLNKHKNKLIIIIFFIVGTVVGNSINLSKLYYGYDRNRYDEACRLLEKNEKEALEILGHINFEEIDYSMNEVTNGKQLWLENIKIANNIALIENASWEIKQSGIRIKDYCILRLQHCALLMKKLQADSVSQYDREIMNLESDIDKFLEKNATLLIVQ